VTSERRVRLRGHPELFVREAGDGPPLVLLHGWPQHGAVWDPLIEDLARDHRVLVPDLRGFGRSQAPSGRYDKHAMAADVLALLDAEGIEKATIVGHDWGGWIAWLLALEHPERVERFAGLDEPPPWAADSGLSLRRLPGQLVFTTYQWAIGAPFLGQRLVSSPKWLHRFIAGGSRRRDVWTRERLEQYSAPLTEPARARASVLLYRTFLLLEVPGIMLGSYTGDELEVPGLMIMGAESPISKLLGIPRERDNLQVETLPGVGHYVIDEAPDQVLALLRPFLAAGRDGSESKTASIAE
jgi:pimeloyl-ACP methyl ester carboxylesterase